MSKRTKGDWKTPRTDKLGYLVGENSKSAPSAPKSAKRVPKQNAQLTLTKDFTRATTNILQPPALCNKLKWRKTLSKNRFITLREGDVFFGDLKFRHFPPIYQERPTDPIAEVLTNRIYDVNHICVLDERSQNGVQIIEQVQFSDLIVQPDNTGGKPNTKMATQLKEEFAPNSLWRPRGQIATPDFMVIYAPHDEMIHIMDYIMYNERFVTNNKMQCGAYSPYVTPEMFLGLIKEKHPYAIFYYKYVLDSSPEVYGIRETNQNTPDHTSYKQSTGYTITGHWQKIEWHRTEDSYFDNVPCDQYDKVLGELTIGLTNEEGRVSECFQDMYIEAEALYRVEKVKGSVLYMKELPEYMPEPYMDVLADFEGKSEFKDKEIEGLTPKFTELQNQGEMFAVYSRFWYCQTDRNADDDAMQDYNNTQEMIRKDNNNPLLAVAGNKDEILACLGRQIEAATSVKATQKLVDKQYVTKVEEAETDIITPLTVKPSMKAPTVLFNQAQPLNQKTKFGVPKAFCKTTAKDGLVYDQSEDYLVIELTDANGHIVKWEIKYTLNIDDDLMLGYNQTTGEGIRNLPALKVMNVYRIVGTGTSSNPFRQYGKAIQHINNLLTDETIVTMAYDPIKNKVGFLFLKQDNQKPDAAQPIGTKLEFLNYPFVHPGFDMVEDMPVQYIVQINTTTDVDGCFFLRTDHNIGKFKSKHSSWGNLGSLANVGANDTDGQKLIYYMAHLVNEGTYRQWTDQMRKFYEEMTANALQLKEMNAEISSSAWNNPQGQITEDEEEDQGLNKTVKLSDEYMSSMMNIITASGGQAKGAIDGSTGVEGQVPEESFTQDPFTGEMPKLDLEVITEEKKQGGAIPIVPKGKFILGFIGGLPAYIPSDPQSDQSFKDMITNLTSVWEIPPSSNGKKAAMLVSYAVKCDEDARNAEIIEWQPFKQDNKTYKYLTYHEYDNAHHQTSINRHGWYVKTQRIVGQQGETVTYYQAIDSTAATAVRLYLLNPGGTIKWLQIPILYTCLKTPGSFQPTVPEGTTTKYKGTHFWIVYINTVNPKHAFVGWYETYGVVKYVSIFHDNQIPKATTFTMPSGLKVVDKSSTPITDVVFAAALIVAGNPDTTPANKPMIYKNVYTTPY